MTKRNGKLAPREETKEKMKPITREGFHALLKKAATTVVKHASK